MKKILIALTLLLSACHLVKAQTRSVGGVVIDSLTNKPMEYIAVYIEKTSSGCVTNYNGEFFLTDNSDKNILVVDAIGYKTKRIVLKPGKTSGLKIKMQSESINLDGAVVKPKREKYRKKENPAVELIRNVIANKGKNRLESKEHFKSDYHEKLTLSLDDYQPNLEKKKNMQFVQEHIDTSEITGKPILTFSIREKICDYYYRKSPYTEKTVQKAVRHLGLDEELDRNGGLTATLDQLFTGVDIFDNEIAFIANRFVSPVSSTLATSYYKYYIMDTVKVDNVPCIDLAFVPFNSQSFGFTGRLYITTDGNYSVKKVQMNFPSSSNINWIDKLRIDQTFQQTEDGLWALTREDSYVNLTLYEGTQGIFAHQTRSFGNFVIDENLADHPAYRIDGPTKVLPDAKKQGNEFWAENRITSLNSRELAIEKVTKDFQENTNITFWTRALDAFVSEWIPAGKSKEVSKFDIGPVLSFLSWDHTEGWRVRVGGMTTAHLNNRWFANGYLAYGFKDRKVKGSLELTHSFNEKNYHKNEKPVNNLSFSYTYDIFSPETLGEQHDIVTSFKTKSAVKYQYIQKIRMNYEKQWLNSLRSNLWLENDIYNPATEFTADGLPANGTLFYRLQGAEDPRSYIKNFMVSEFGASLRWAPGERVFNAVSQRANIDKDTPIFTLTHKIGTAGYNGGEWNFGKTANSFLYNSTQLEIFKRFRISIAGFLDAKVTAGKIWNQVPYNLLMLPASNQSFSYRRETFHTMNALEFVTDQYVQANLTWHMKGLILNRIPLLKRLKLREIICYNIAYGSLTDKNNPALHPGRLFELPEGTMALDGKRPYMEIGMGLENIFQLFRVVYYYRIPTYPHPENADFLSKWGRLCIGVYADF